MSIKHIFVEEISNNECWADKIFKDNIDIVAFGMSRDEIDIWWLLTFRAYLYYSNAFGLRQYINNRVRFHHVAESVDEDMKYALNNMRVEYVFHGISSKSNENYLLGYIQIAEQLG